MCSARVIQLRFSSLSFMVFSSLWCTIIPTGTRPFFDSQTTTDFSFQVRGSATFTYVRGLPFRSTPNLSEPTGFHRGDFCPFLNSDSGDNLIPFSPLFQVGWPIENEFVGLIPSLGLLQFREQNLAVNSRYGSTLNGFPQSAHCFSIIPNDTTIPEPCQTVRDYSIACLNHGYNLTACELDEDYFKAATERIQREASQQVML